MNMFGVGEIASSFLNSIDSAAKETLEEVKTESATIIRQRRKETGENKDIASDIEVIIAY
jgi:hypothetical protein